MADPLDDQNSEGTVVDPYGPGSGWGQDTLSNMGLTNDTNVFNAPTSGIDWSKVGNWAKNVFTGKGGIGDYGALFAGALGLYEALNKDNTPKTWQGTIARKPLGALEPVAPTADYLKAIQNRPYGSAAMGMDPSTYKAPAIAAPPVTPPVTLPGIQQPANRRPLSAGASGIGQLPAAAGAMQGIDLDAGRYANWMKGFKPTGGYDSEALEVLKTAYGQNKKLFTDLVGDPSRLRSGYGNPYEKPVEQAQIDYLRLQETLGSAHPTTKQALEKMNALDTQRKSWNATKSAEADKSQNMQMIAGFGNIDFTNPNDVANNLRNLTVDDYNYRRTLSDQSAAALVETAKQFRGAALAADYSAGRLTYEQANALPKYMEAKEALAQAQQQLKAMQASNAPKSEGLEQNYQRTIALYQDAIDRYSPILKGVDFSALDFTKINTAKGASDFAGRAGAGPQAQHIIGGSKSEFTPTPEVSTQEINQWLASNPQASDADIRAAMDKYGVTAGQMAKAAGIPLEQVQARYEAAGPKKAAEGGLMGLARGGALPPRYLRGETDGMKDQIPSSIDGVQPAKLSHGEFVIPADVVSHLGNGNSDAGAKVLYKMMDRVRQARTGTKKQGRRINPEKFTPGGIAGYASGGAVAFQTGGTTVNPTGGGGTLSGGLSPYIGDYVADYLGKGWTLSEKPYQAYQGPLTAGVSPLQQQAFQGISGLQVPSSIGQAAQAATGITNQMQGMRYTPVGTSFTGAPNMPARGGPAEFTYDPYVPLGPGGPPGPPIDPNTGMPINMGATKPTYSAEGVTPGFKGPAREPGMFGGADSASIAQQYMNPYLQAALDPTLRELTRQSDIARSSDAARLAQAGAFGGSRQAIMESEGRRNLLGKQADVLSQGYASAYDRAMQQFNADQARKIQEAQFGSTYGLQALQGALGGAQTAAGLGQQQLEAQKGILGAQLGAGATQQAAQQAAIDAQIKQFQEAQMWPYKQLQFQQSLLQGLPVSTSTTSPNTSMFSDLLGGIGELMRFRNMLGGK